MLISRRGGTFASRRVVEVRDPTIAALLCIERILGQSEWTRALQGVHGWQGRGENAVAEIR